MSLKDELKVQIQVGECEYCGRRYPMIQLASGQHILVQPVPVQTIQPVVRESDQKGGILGLDGKPVKQQSSADKYNQWLMEFFEGRRPGIHGPPMAIEHELVCNRKAGKERKSRPVLLMDFDQIHQERNKAKRFGQPGNTTEAN